MKVIYKASDTSRAGTAIASADPDLTFPLLANSSYLIRGQMYFKGSTTGGMKHGFSVGGATLIRGTGYTWKWRYVRLDTIKTYEENGGAWPPNHFISGQCRAIAMADGAYSIPIKFIVLLDIGDTAGQFSVIWSQSVADVVNPAKLLAGAIMTYEILP